ncbi:MAG: GNAT family N-acetyltransferase [Leptolyngbyaceae cyanobacterium bins.349]|nr:GNAT family N-acetyltransferase [Leptolyngbyaceae cyanobacterium bins.349]
MTQAFPPNSDLSIRPVYYSDFEAIERFCTSDDKDLSYSINPEHSSKPVHAYGPLRLLGMLLNRPQMFGAYPSDRDSKLQGVIQVSPFNRTRSTWRVDQVAVVPIAVANQALESMNQDLDASSQVATVTNSSPPTMTLTSTLNEVGSLLLRHCFETIWEARTWLLEIDINNKELLALYRQNGFQPLAHMTHWEIDPEQLQELAEREPDLPNLLPVSNADAQLLYQLDTMSMPANIRQVFDRHIADFKTSLVGSLLRGMKNWLSHVEVVSGYVFEPQRKAAIGYFQVQLCRDGSTPHQAQLTVNPAYTWLYPELMSQMARITRELPAQSLRLASSDYQPEREEYLERMGASRFAHTLMMSRSVWHKVRESKLGALENLQLPEVLQGLKPSRKAIPSRIVAIPPTPDNRPTTPTSGSFSKLGKPGNTMLNLPAPTDPPQEGPCC